MSQSEASSELGRLRMSVRF